MAFEKGRKKTGGRQSGALNKKTELLIEKCERFGIDPFETLLELIKSNEPALKLSAAKEACQYVHPKRRAVEVDASVSGTTQETDPELARQFQQLLEMNKEAEERLRKELHDAKEEIARLKNQIPRT